MAVAALAVRTLKWLFAGVSAYVDAQIVAFATLMRTMGALEVAHVSMLCHMRAVVVSRLERLATNITRKGPHIVVNSLDVRLQLELVGEHLGAQIATVSFGVLRFMHVELRLGIAPERAVITLEILLRVMRNQMLLGIELAAKPLLAFGALEFAVSQAQWLIATTLLWVEMVGTAQMLHEAAL